MHFEISVSVHMGSKTHTCPSGAYVEPEMVNSFREQLFPFAWSTMNIWNKKDIKKKEFKLNLNQQVAGHPTTDDLWCLKAPHEKIPTPPDLDIPALHM